MPSGNMAGFMVNYIVTGATSGLGLEAVRRLASRDPGSRILAGARNPARADGLRGAVPEDQLWVSPLDTSSMKSVARFAQAVLAHLDGAPVHGLALNAGVQFVTDTLPSADGHDLTFATNVLGHIALFRALQPALSKKTVIVSTASGTHDERNRLARSSGFRGAFFPSAKAVAAGKVSDADTERQRGMDRYATSKLCNVMFTYAMARRHGGTGPRFIAFDPGMMPGTGLARDHSRIVQFAWKALMPRMVAFMDAASTPQRSGGVLADILAQDRFPTGTGLHIEFTGKQIPSSDLSYSETNQDALVSFADAQINGESPLQPVEF